MNNTQQSILKTLAYFDIFHYPLTNEEIQSYLLPALSLQIVNEQLALLVDEGIVFKLQDFYALKNEPALATRRRKGNEKALKEMKNAARAARILSRFPYVEGLAISGSLSKNFADENTDVDFFIITSANRLWIARTLMHFFYKLTLLTRSNRLFCMNYYVDEEGLEIKEKNIYTAMEIVTLVPMQGKDVLQHFIKSNSWTNAYFPGRPILNDQQTKIKKGMFRKMTESLFNGKLGDATDRWLMDLTNKRWIKKTERQEVNHKGIRMSMMVDRHFAKPDPVNFQQKVLDQYDASIRLLIPTQQTTSLLVS